MTDITTTVETTNTTLQFMVMQHRSTGLFMASCTTDKGLNVFVKNLDDIGAEIRATVADVFEARANR